MTTRALGPLALVIALAACGGESSGGPDAGGERALFIALQKDFVGYRGWTRFELGESPPEVFHAGRRTLYLNEVPPSGRTSFPVGTIIVKEVVPSAGDPMVFAMVKRGGGYNSAGAPDWEWFELKDNAQGQPVLVWRGIAPPSGEGYITASGGTCNECHGAATDNDSVLAPELRLSEF